MEESEELYELDDHTCFLMPFLNESVEQVSPDPAALGNVNRRRQLLINIFSFLSCCCKSPCC